MLKLGLRLNRKNISKRIFSANGSSISFPAFRNGTYELTVGAMHQMGVEYILSFNHSSLSKNDIVTYCQYFICHVLTNDQFVNNYSKSYYDKHLSVVVNEHQFRAYKKLCMEMAHNPFKPVQYILGNECFYGNMIECVPPILIPRPETEDLIELMKTHLTQRYQDLKNEYGDRENESFPILHMLDIGSGSGIIGLSVLQPSPHGSKPTADCVDVLCRNLHVTAIDINQEAVSLSTRNATRILTRTKQLHQYQCLYTSFLDFTEKFRINDHSHQLFDVIVSNPPYISTSDYLELDRSVLDYEDRCALDGGHDHGLVIIKQIVKNCSILYKPDIKIKKLYMEVDLKQIPLLKEWCISEEGQLYCEPDAVKTDANGHACIETFKDFTGRERFVCVHIK